MTEYRTTARASHAGGSHDWTGKVQADSPEDAMRIGVDTLACITTQPATFVMVTWTSVHEGIASTCLTVPEAIDDLMLGKG